jgi:HAD superfamily hydrolase (TIGR01549 family)
MTRASGNHREPIHERGSNGPAILFDLDGTLVDSVYQHVIAWRAALLEADIDYPSWKIHRHVGMGGDLFVQAVFRELGLRLGEKKTEQIQKSKQKHYARFIPEIQALPGASELLKLLTGLKVPWAVATSGGEKEIQPLIKLIKLPTGALIVNGDDVVDAKPHPDVFLEAAKRLSVQLSDCFVVGDSDWDLMAAGRAKALGVGFRCGGYGEDELGRAGAYRIYQDPADLLKHLEDLGIHTG